MAAASLLIIGWLATECLADDSPSESPQAKPGESSPIHISNETTRLSGPLDGQGFVDYLAALNKRDSEGVTPENNAAVPLVQALGIKGDVIFRGDYFQLLGIEALPEQGDYLTDHFVQFEKLIDRKWTKDDYDAFLKAVSNPWSPKDHPTWVEWLKSNENPLGLIVESTRRSKCYFPLVKATGAESLASVLIEPTQETRAAARALLIRAMLRLHEGKLKEAQDDILACHRLARLVGTAPFFVSTLMSAGIERMAQNADTALLESGQLSAANALAYLAELQSMPPLPSGADELDSAERLLALDAATTLARLGAEGVEEVLANEDGGLKQAVAGLLAKPSLIDWDEVLRVENEYFDKLARAARKTSVTERGRAFQKLDEEIAVSDSDPLDARQLAATFRKGPPEGKVTARRLGTLLRNLVSTDITIEVVNVEARVRMRAALTEVGFALAAYRAENGAYPERLEVLKPKYIAELPNDCYNEQPPHYVRNEAHNGYVLYSVGPNGNDNEGRTEDSDPPADDISLQIPRAVSTKN